MLSKQQRNNISQISLRGGMRNVAFIAGTAHALDATGGYILQSNNLNERIRFELDGSTTMPSWIQEGRPLKVVCRIIPRMVQRIYYNEDAVSAANEEHPPATDQVLNQTLRVLFFEKPSVFDMDPRKAWRKTLRVGVPEAPVPAPEATGVQGSEDRPATAAGEGDPPPTQVSEKTLSPSIGRVFDNGNDVKIAGFVQKAIVEKKTGKDSDGKSNCLVLLVRQTEDPSDILYVRCFTPQVEAVKNKIKPGTPLSIQGKLRVHLKNTGRVNSAGHHVVSAIQYVHCVLNGLGIPDDGDIAFEPTWTKELVNQGKPQKVNTGTKKAEDKPPEVEKVTDSLDANVEI